MSDMPRPLDKLLRRLTLLIRTATDVLEARPARVATWQREVTSQLTRYHAAAYLAGADATEVVPAAAALIGKDLRIQLTFLNRFALEIKHADEWQAGWNARAAMYAQSIKVPYWRGATKLLPLPAMPAEGTQCLTNCGCAWEVSTVDAEAGDYDAYWRRAKEDSCQTCVQRAAEWSPVRIRKGVLQLA